MKLHTYPLTLAAVKKNESSLWDIGDALVKECPPDSKYGALAEVVDYLQANGCDYTERWLEEIRRVALAFPPNRRRRSFAFVVHQEAGTPQMLEAVVKGAPKGTVISHRYVRKILDQIQAREEHERREAFEKAQAKHRAAEAEQREKFAKKERAKNESERKKLAEEHRQAIRRTEEAKADVQAARVPPKKDLPPPMKEDVPILLAESEFMANAERSIVLAKQSIKAIEGSLDQLTAKGVAALTEVSLEAANAWTEAAQVVRKEVLDQRGHLSVVEH